MSEDAVAELFQRAGKYAAEVVAKIKEHRYHGIEHATAVVLDAIEPDIARAYALGYVAALETKVVKP